MPSVIPASGAAHAEAALTIIAANGDRPLDVALLQLARAEALRALGDVAGSEIAIRLADEAASTLGAEELRAQFASERARVVAGLE